MWLHITGSTDSTVSLQKCQGFWHNSTCNQVMGKVALGCARSCSHCMAVALRLCKGTWARCKAQERRRPEFKTSAFHAKPLFPSRSELSAQFLHPPSASGREVVAPHKTCKHWASWDSMPLSMGSAMHQQYHLTTTWACHNPVDVNRMTKAVRPWEIHLSCGKASCSIPAARFINPVIAPIVFLVAVPVRVPVARSPTNYAVAHRLSQGAELYVRNPQLPAADPLIHACNGRLD